MKHPASFNTVYKGLFLVSCFVGVLSLPAQNIEWERNYGGSLMDQANCVRQTSDGGYIVAGYTWSSDSNVSGPTDWMDGWVVKLNSSGGIEWDHTYGTPSRNDAAYSIIQTSDGGFALAGVSGPSMPVGATQTWVVKMDSSGQELWNRQYGNMYNWASSIQETSDGGYVVAGTSLSPISISEDYQVMKIDKSGNLVWSRTYGGTQRDMATSIQETIEGEYIVAGSSVSSDGDVSGNYGGVDCWIIKLDNGGNIQWEQHYGGSKHDLAHAIQQTFDGGFIVAGHSSSSDHDVSANYGGADYWLIKLNSTGQIEWENNYGGSSYDIASSVQQVRDGGYVAAGYSKSRTHDVCQNNGSEDFWVIMVDSAGNLMWNRNYGGSGVDEAKSIQQTTDGGFIVAGSSESSDGDVSANYEYYDYWVVKLDSSAACTPDSGTATLTECVSYTSPSGRYTWTTSGTYQDTIHTMDCCDSIVTLNLTIKTVDTSVTQNGATLTANASGATYQWIDCDEGAPIPGAINQSFTAPANGNYAVVITENGCSHTSECYAVTTIGINDHSFASKIKLYPNPTKGTVAIDMGEIYSPVEISVTNTLGQVVRQERHKTSRVVQLSIPGAAGIYFIQIKAEDKETTTLKAVKF